MSTSATGRWLVAGVLAACLALATAVALGSWWARGLIYDTDRWVEAMGPVIEDPAFQQALSDQIAGQVTDRVQEELAQLPPLLQDALGGVADRFTGVVDDTVSTVVASPEFADAWVAANRTGHEQVAGSLTGQNDVIGVTDGQVSISSQVFVDAGAAGLDEAGLGAVVPYLPETQGSVVLFQSDALGLVQASLRVLNAIGGWLWLLAVGLAVAVVALAPRRVRGLTVAAGAVLLGGLLVLLGLQLLRAGYLASTPVLPEAAKSIIFAALSASLRDAVALVLAVAGGVLLVAVVADVVASRRRPA